MDKKKVLENKSASLSELKSAFEKLQTNSHRITQELYKASGAQPGAEAAQGTEGGEQAGQAKSGDDVIDADFKDVN